MLSCNAQDQDPEAIPHNPGKEALWDRKEVLQEATTTVGLIPNGFAVSKPQAGAVPASLCGGAGGHGVHPQRRWG